MNPDQVFSTEFEKWLSEVDPEQKKFFDFLQKLITQKIDDSGGELPRQLSLPGKVTDYGLKMPEHPPVLTASQMASGILYHCVEDAERAVEEVEEIIHQEPLLKKQAQVLGRWLAKSEEWHFHEITGAIASTMDKLEQENGSRKKRGLTKRSRKSRPYNRAAERICSQLESCDVKYPTFLSACVLWYCGFSSGDLQTAAVVVTDWGEPISTYQGRGEDLRGLDIQVRQRIRKDEDKLVELLREKVEYYPEDSWMGKTIRRMLAQMEEVSNTPRTGRFRE